MNIRINRSFSTKTWTICHMLCKCTVSFLKTTLCCSDESFPYAGDVKFFRVGNLFAFGISDAILEIAHTCVVPSLSRFHAAALQAWSHFSLDNFAAIFSFNFILMRKFSSSVI